MTPFFVRTAGQSQTYYHGTTAPGLTHVLPQSAHGQRTTFPSITDTNYGYATANPAHAWHYAELAWNANAAYPGPPRVYQVQSNGDEEQDPGQDEQGNSRSNFEGDVRSPTGFKVMQEMPMPEEMGAPEEWR